MPVVKHPKWPFCPACAKPATFAYSRYRKSAAIRVRYFHCAGCKQYFHIKERLTLTGR